jgi:hypothetical protein
LKPLGVLMGASYKKRAASNTSQAQNVTMRGTQMTRNVVVVFAFWRWVPDIPSSTASKKIRMQIAKAALIKI